MQFNMHVVVGGQEDADEKAAYDKMLAEGRFSDPQRFARTVDDKEGLAPAVSMEDPNNIMLDFGRPVQTLGMTISDAKKMVIMLIEATTVAMMKAEALKESGQSPTQH